jgi:hypothetical protein
MRRRKPQGIEKTRTSRAQNRKGMKRSITDYEERQKVTGKTI